ncbi:MAG TPA: hypothetical protein PKX52_03595 [Methanomassiliicoccaceae archaeon]|jgi:hypothetical protein|nr:hypothetical protein [Euryarchaeota archaeon]HOB38440.1 hypothetical protein [Methanomassiliicoccaceae archaeon]HOQ25549.1 hypothetical protein [Methanomassiliicoccaceae archaeon]HPT73966.1 hypothetical protein [Methanomassiliicoccaceae archaeon]HQA20545.1 hypothetical protein [Methanomassiliicoccaceae archaeon]
MTEDAVPLGVTLGSIFDERAEQYDAWFDEHAAAYWSELGALRKASREGIGLDAGVGTGRFTGSMGMGSASTRRHRCSRSPAGAA